MQGLRIWISNNQIAFCLIVFAFFCGFCFLTTYLLTQPAFSRDWDFSQTGQIGDTIGGLTAPVINILGALLVYFSFREQKKANDNQNKALIHEMKLSREKANSDLLYKLYAENKEDLLLIEYNSKKGLDALSEICDNGVIFEKSEYFDSFLAIVYRLNNIYDKLEKEQLDPTDKDYLKKSAELFYLSKIQKPFDTAYEIAKKTNDKNVLPYLELVKKDFEKHFEKFLV